MQTTQTCPTCNGEGTTITTKCTACHGHGTVQGEEIISINIPAGVAEGMQLSVSGKGNAAERGGVNGDLIIQIEELEDDYLKRDGNNIIYDLYISFPDAVLGISTEIPTVDGKVKVKIEPGTQAGKILRLKGKGLPSVNQYGRGDQLINVNVWTPQKLTPEEKEIIQKLNGAENFKPNPSKTEKGFFERMKEFFN